MRNAILLGAALAACAFVILLSGDYGLYLIDEMFYRAMAQRMAEAGALSIENGWSEYPIEPMRVLFLREGVEGLYPQYPAGFALVAAPFYAALGLKGLFLLEILSFAACVPLTAALAKRLTGADDVAAFRAAAFFAFATFAADYAIAIWPHALSGLFVLAGWVAAAQAWNGGERGWMIASGLALSLGLTIRVDVLLAIPPVAAFALSHPARPRFALGWLLAGLAPGLALASAMNYAKFGVFSPISYGASEGGVSLSGHAALFPAVALFALGALALRDRRVRSLALSPWALPVAIAGVALVAAAPVIGPVARAMLAGAYGLFVDSQSLGVAKWIRMFTEIEGFIAPFGVLKLAVFQSMPWLPVAIVAAVAAIWSRDGANDRTRSGLVFCLVAICVYVAPFAKTGWHGGLSNSMRYFWPLLPLFAILGSSAWTWIWARSGGTPRLAAMGLFAGAGFVVVAIGVLLTGGEDTRVAGAEVQLYAPLAIGALAALAAILSLIPRKTTAATSAGAAMAAFAASVGAAAAATFWDDAPRSLDRRAEMAFLSREMESLPERSFIISLFPAIFSAQFSDDNMRVANAFGASPEDLATLAERHLSSGWSVFAWPIWVGEQVADASGDALRAEPLDASKDLAKITRAP